MFAAGPFARKEMHNCHANALARTVINAPIGATSYPFKLNPDESSRMSRAVI